MLGLEMPAMMFDLKNYDTRFHLEQTALKRVVEGARCNHQLMSYI